LSALSASLQHVVGADELVTANALSTTAGALATTAGGGVAIGLRALLGGASAGSYATTAAVAFLPYLVSALLARRFPRHALGPDDAQRAGRESAAEIVRGLAAGVAHLRGRRPALLALGAIGVNRLCYGLFAVCAVLLFRNYYTAEGPLRVGLAGLAQLVGAVAIGGGLAALVTPAASRRLGFVAWSSVLLALAGVVQLVLVLPYRLPLHVAAALLLGFCAQGIKICVDTVVQRTVEDDFRGRVFAFYDMLFNVALVTAAVVTALALPDDGYAPSSVVVVAAVYLLAAAGYARAGGRQPVIAAEPTTV
ncbi:MAG: MFS transporter, partial [Jatrophihabitantaceae bacterium]